MRAALEEDALDAAVSLYAEAQPLLHKYGAKSTFKAIAVEADFVAQEISQVGRAGAVAPQGSCCRRGGGGAGRLPQDSGGGVGGVGVGVWVGGGGWGW